MRGRWLAKHLEVLAGNCIVGKFGGRAIKDWAGFLVSRGFGFNSGGGTRSG